MAEGLRIDVDIGHLYTNILYELERSTFLKLLFLFTTPSQPFLTSKRNRSTASDPLPIALFQSAISA